MKLKIRSSKLSHVAVYFSSTNPLSAGRGRITSLGFSRNRELLGASSLTPNSLSSLSPRRRIRSAIAAPVASPNESSSQVQLETEDDQLLHQCNNERKTVQVKLQLKRECKFGEQFLVVGDDPLLGSWDPSIAVPMDWSDGHLWTAELDVPIDKAVQFKFILRKVCGEILWQPGEDRSLQLWETQSILTVLEDWDDEQARLVKEEEEGFMTDSADAVITTTNTETLATTLVADDNYESELSNDSVTTLNGEHPKGGTHWDSLADGNPDHVRGGLTPPSKYSTNNGESLEEIQPELLDVDLASAAQSTNEMLDAGESVGNPEDAKVSAEKEEQQEVSKLMISTQQQLAFSNYGQQQHCSEPEAGRHLTNQREEDEESGTEKFIWENDIKWGKETLKKFLNSLGFL